MHRFRGPRWLAAGAFAGSCAAAMITAHPLTAAAANVLTVSQSAAACSGTGVSITAGVAVHSDATAYQSADVKQTTC